MNHGYPTGVARRSTLLGHGGHGGERKCRFQVTRIGLMLLETCLWPYEHVSNIGNVYHEAYFYVAKELGCEGIHSHAANGREKSPSRFH